MATTSNTYTGNGSNKLFSITFPYLETTDVDVYLNGTLQTITTQYTFANATTIEFTTAPANGATVLLDRSTDDATLQATFFPGSSIKAADLNLDFDQVLYIAQETSNEATTATSTAASATTTANTALSQSSAAVSTANTASSNASAAVSTANTASTNASNAVTTANTASSNASTAVTTANAAVVTANTASSNASTALSTANTALTNANSAVTTANTASSNATAAVSTANTASTNASTAVTTANNAVTTANSAVTTANTANTNSNTAVTTANAAAAAVANAVLYTTVADVAAIPGSPANNAAVEVTNSTGIQSFTPLSGLPAGFIGSSGLSVRIIYQTSGATWTWIQYFPNDPETRYLKLGGGTMTGALAHPLGAAATPSITFTGDTNTGIYSPGADQVAISTGGSGRLFVDASGNVGVGAVPTTRLEVARLGNTWTGAAAVTGTALFLHNGNNSAASPANIQISTGNATSGRIYFGDSDNASRGIIEYDHADDHLHLSTNGSERLRITSAGLVGIGTSSPSSLLEVFTSAGDGNAILTLTGNIASGSNVAAVDFKRTTGTVNASIRSESFSSNDAGALYLSTRPSGGSLTQRLYITPEGNVGIGASNPQYKLDISPDAAGAAFRIRAGTSGQSLIQFTDNGISAQWGVITTTAGSCIFEHTSVLRFTTASSERARIDSSGRLLVGTSTSVNTFSVAPVFQIAGSTAYQSNIAYRADAFAPFISVGHSRSATVGTQTILQSGDDFGTFAFVGSDGTGLIQGARISAAVDGTPGTNDMPGRLVFSTTADGASSPTERFRIGSAGQLGIGGTNYGTSGQVLTSQGSGTAPVWSTAGGGFASGTVMLFVQTTAPTGWTKSTTHDDKALRVVSGTAGTGGSTAFTSVFASRTPSGTVGATTLTEAQIPSHTHSFTACISTTSTATGALQRGASPVGSTTGATGGGTSHDHSFTGTAMDFAVQYVDVIIATKD